MKPIKYPFTTGALGRPGRLGALSVVAAVLLQPKTVDKGARSRRGENGVHKKSFVQLPLLVQNQ